MLAWATPGTASNRGFSVQSTKVRRSRGDILSESIPILRRSMVDEVSGDITGACTPSGNCRAKVESRSESACRTR